MKRWVWLLQVQWKVEQCAPEDMVPELGVQCKQGFVLRESTPIPLKRKPSFWEKGNEACHRTSSEPQDPHESQNQRAIIQAVKNLSKNGHNKEHRNENSSGNKPKRNDIYRVVKVLPMLLPLHIDSRHSHCWQHHSPALSSHSPLPLNLQPPPLPKKAPTRQETEQNPLTMGLQFWAFCHG